jgi:hypothetical protein
MGQDNSSAAADAFDDELRRLVSKHLQAARRDTEFAGAMIEAIASSLGFSVGVISEGRKALIDKLVIGIEAHIHAEAVAASEMVAAMVRRARP